MSYHLKSIKLETEKYPTRDHYPFSLALFSETRELHFPTAVTLFAGENGSGKSTLLEAIATAAGIYIWRTGMNTRYRYNRYEASLHRYLKVQWTDGMVPGSFFGAQIFKDFASILEEWAATDPGQLELFGGKSLMTQSHGQSLMSFFRNRYKLKGLYLLDEPETALSPSSQLELLQLLSKNAKAGHAQFIVATHSPILLACREATIYSFDKMPVSTVTYENTEHFRVYRDFLNNRDKYLID
ncbi:AAA family ATPase [Maribellus maritimus]|uniref:AAA family ATPase n=1 Tax=Maribellus maritimus TaxID=2870838 RepID=UPI001EECA24A|nr:AAA family ATPase [Maribellus maritimus]MCG6191250.1 AAA family ATPase [Maribellus maritimus]